MAPPPRAKWTDDMLDERFRAIEKQAELMRDTFAVLSEMPDGLGRALVASEDRMMTAGRDREERLEKRIAEVSDACRGLWDEYRDERENRAKNRTAGYIGMAGGTLSVCGVITTLLVSTHQLRPVIGGAAFAVIAAFVIGAVFWTLR